MNTEPRWINKAALLLLHEESLAEFGGLRGIRDEGLLDSALARAQNTFGYEPDTSIAALAAAYAFGLAKNHAFIDGNKRAAFLSIGLFLALNGYRLSVSPTEAVQMILAVAASDTDEATLARWIARNSVRI